MLRPAGLQRGFTLVELVAVLVLLGILSAVAFPRMSSVGGYQDRVFQETLLTSLRLAQRTALSHHASSTSWTLTQTSAGVWRYAIALDGVDQHSETLETSLPVRFEVTRDNSNGQLTGTVAVSDTLTLTYDTRGNFIQVSDGVTMDNIASSIQLTMDTRLLCISPTGFAYEGSCI